MKELDKLEKGVLIDMLASRTVEYTHRLNNNQRDAGFKDCLENLSELQREIKNRDERSGEFPPDTLMTA